MFLLGAGLMTMGSVLAVGMLAPIAMPITRRYKIDPLLMGMMISHGVLGAAFSPITVYGAFTNGWLQSAGLPTHPIALYLIPLGLSFLMALALFVARDRDLMRRDEQNVDIDDLPSVGDRPAPTPRGGELVHAATGTGQHAVSARQGVGPTVVTTGPAPQEEQTRLDEIEATGFTPLRVLTLLGMVALLIGGAVFTLDVGGCSMVIAAVLLMLAPNKHKPAVNNKNGTIEFLGDAAASLGSPLLTALILCSAVAAVSAIGSSIGTLGIVLPLAAPLPAMGELGLAGFIAALCLSAVIVDVSPLSSNGVMVPANAEVPDKDKFQRTLFKYTGYVLLVAPNLAWVLVVLPTS